MPPDAPEPRMYPRSGYFLVIDVLIPTLICWGDLETSVLDMLPHKMFVCTYFALLLMYVSLIDKNVASILSGSEINAAE